MAQDFGSGVSRTLSALQRQFGLVVWQADKPPLDSELNLMGQIELDRIAQVVRASMHSGFLLDPMAAQQDFLTDPSWSNFFKLGRTASGELAPIQIANVNGWLLPVSGTSVSEGDASNRVDLWPPPASDTRIDLVFLEAWLAQVAPNPSTANKPAADKLWKYGNVKYGGTNISDDLEDPTIGYETTERVQIQYRIRVYGQGSGLGSSVTLDDYPDGLDDPNVLGQGTAATPVAGFAFTNMRAAGDPGLWRAGDGDPTNDLGTVDGYVYAIPIAAIFRRNSDPFVAREAAGNANQNGAVDRNPISISMTDPAEGTRVLGTATLTNSISEVTTGTVQVTGLVGSGLDNADIDWDSMFLVLDNEVIRISGVNTAVSPATITIRATAGRGRWGTMAVPHDAGTVVKFFNWRHDGLYADQIADIDILDLRRAVTPGEWDYHSLLAHNLSALLKGELRSSYKQAGIGDTQGPVVVEVDTLLADGSVPNQTEALDGPDGIRTIWSDASTLQPDVTMLMAPKPLGLVTQFDTGVTWEVGAQFLPGGFSTDGAGWRNNTVIFAYIGGNDGSSGARGTFRDPTARAVRVVLPKEYWKTGVPDDSTGNQNPITLRLLATPATIPAAGGEPAAQHPGPLYPLPQFNFEKPFIALGGILNPDSISTTVSVFNETAPGASDWEVEITGLDFDTAGAWYSLDPTTGDFANDPGAITKPVLHDTRTLWGMLTQNGQDRTGASSEVYLVIWGDSINLNNNGCFRVVGAGTVGYTNRSATAADRVRVEFINPPSVPDQFVNNTGLRGELRSQYAHSQDSNGSLAAGTAGSALCIVLTDIECETGGALNPWNPLNLGALAISQPVASKMAVNLTLIYHPNHSGTARVADAIDRFAVVTAGSEYLRQSPATRDSSFPSQAGTPDDETYFDPNHVQTWNRLSSQGLKAPDAPSYGGNMVAFSEQDREAELFVDAGSKTVMFRPFLSRAMTLQQTTITAGFLIPANYPPAHGGFAVDGASIFTATPVRVAYEVPPEYMPRFGRQDIPFFVDTTGTGAGTFLQGINHLFRDVTSSGATQFNVVGGEDNAGVAGVKSIRFLTGSTSGFAYGQWGTIPSGGGTLGYQARLYTNDDVRSSDVGRGLRGIQLPPFLGIARLYGVYDLRDYAAAGGATFESNRITRSAGAAPNLLRTDATKQTIFIVQGGASDVTGNANDHTYVIPEDAIDIRLANAYTAGEDFTDLEYVVECVVFGFARGFINGNSYVLARLHSGSGAAAATELASAGMVLPAAAPQGDQCYVAYDRVVYQGDAYMTRAGSTMTTSDYENRYGQIAQSSAYAARLPIQQSDSDGNIVPETINVRALEVLAAMDFWTTLGTGRISGQVFPGTPLDVGFTVENLSGDPATRIPATSTAGPWQVFTRAFTEGQRSNTNHASVDIDVINNGVLAGSQVAFTLPTGTTVVVSNPADWAVGATAVDTAANIAAAIQATPRLAIWLTVYAVGQRVHVEARFGGSEGTLIQARVSTSTGFAIRVPQPVDGPTTRTNALLAGGLDKPMNALASLTNTSPVQLTGMTERLPMGLLLQDADFLGEDPLRDSTSYLWSSMGAVAAAGRLPVPLTGSEEYTRLVGGVGSFIGMSDGAILHYTPYDESLSPTGTKYFRLYRGGGSAYVISGVNPGGPVDWVAGAFQADLQPVLKGGVLVGRAFLVRNFSEEAYSGSDLRSHGDELQMVILTNGILGSGSPAWVPQTQVSLSGSLSPTGYGEGYAAADRYRLEGKPFTAGHTREPPSLTPDLALFPFNTIAVNADPGGK